MRRYTHFVLPIVDRTISLPIPIDLRLFEAAQVDVLNRNGVEKLSKEKASGTSRNGRSASSSAIELARKGDALVVTRLDRLAQSAPDLYAIANELRTKRVDLVVTGHSIDTTTTSGRLTVNMLGAICRI